MPIETGARIAQNTGRALLRKLPAASSRILQQLGVAADRAFGTDAVSLGHAIVREAPSWLRPIIERYRLTEAPALITHLPKIAQVAGKDAIDVIARRAAGNQGAFARDIVALAEKSGYQDLAGLQQALPVRHLVVDGCAFCQVQRFQPPGTILTQTPNFAVGPMRKPLYTVNDNAGHLLIFPRHHRSVIGATPETYRREFQDLAARVKTALEKQYAQPASIISNALPGHPYDAGAPYDTHAHIQVFTGNANISEEVIRFFGWSRAEASRRVYPVAGWEDYYRLYERGLLRERYMVTMDASGQGHVIVIGDLPTGSGFARRMVSQALDRKHFSNGDDEKAARKMAEDLRGKL